MSDNSNSTGSTGSSTNSWTLLSPEEAAIENVGPVDDGTESLGDVPSLSEEVAGAAAEFKPLDIPVETVLSEEGHQVCQETSPESSEGPVPSSPSRLSPLPSSPLDPPDLDLESQPPIIHDIVTTSPNDNEPQGAMPFVTNIDLGSQMLLDVPAAEILPAEPEESSSAEVPVTEEMDVTAAAGLSPDETESRVFGAETDVNITTQSQTETEPDPSHVVEETEKETEPTRDEKPEGEEEEEEEAPAETELTKPSETQDDREEEEEASSSFDTVSGFDDGLRRRNLPPFDTTRPRTSDEDDEEEEEEVQFKLTEKKEEKPWFSMNRCIVGALVLLFLGSLFLSGDLDAPELSDGEQSQDWLSADPQDMKELLDKLTQENQKITELEAQLQTQKEELDVALKALATNGDDEKGKADLEKENNKLKEELSTLPVLKEELESLRTRITELSQLTVPAPSSPPESEIKDKTAGPEKRKEKHHEGKMKEELKRQKVLLEESKKRLDGMKKKDERGKGVRENLEKIQKRLSEQVEKWGKKKKMKNQEGNKWKKEEKKENSHKEAWRRNQDEWERKKEERRMDREERRKDKHHHHHHQKKNQKNQKQHPHPQQDFWGQQELKLRRLVRPQLGCSSVEACAGREGLFPVELPEFEELLEGYLSKLTGGEEEEEESASSSSSSPSRSENKERIRKLTAGFFQDGVFIHDRVRFSDFAEDVADILEDMVDVLEDDDEDDDGQKKKKNDSLEEEMEEFEREALWKFSATA